jgi:hypothetical protein
MKRSSASEYLVGMRQGTLEKLAEGLTSDDSSLVSEFTMFCFYTVDSHIECDLEGRFRYMTYAQVVKEVCKGMRASCPRMSDLRIDKELEAVFGTDTGHVMNFIGGSFSVQGATAKLEAELRRRDTTPSLLDRFLADSSE